MRTLVRKFYFRLQRAKFILAKIFFDTSPEKEEFSYLFPLFKTNKPFIIFLNSGISSQIFFPTILLQIEEKNFFFPQGFGSVKYRNCFLILLESFENMSIYMSYNLQVTFKVLFMSTSYVIFLELWDNEFRYNMTDLPGNNSYQRNMFTNLQ